MTYTHTTRYLRVSPKKLRVVARAVRGMTAAQALTFLAVQPQKGAQLISKALVAARNNAEQAGVKVDELVISSIAAQKGPVFMRRWIKPKGRSTPKRKPTTHAVILFVEETTAMRKTALKREKKAAATTDKKTT